MKVAVFLTIWTQGISAEDLNEHFLGKPLKTLKANASVETVEYYVPCPGDVPKLDDVPSPTGIMQVGFDSEAAAKGFVSSDTFSEMSKVPSGLSGRYEKVHVELLQAVHYPLPEYDEPPTRTAALSFVVRYYGPVSDQADFVEFYTQHHPPLLAKFPNVRNVLCYLPLGYETNSEISDDTIVIGNEVVFDDLASLKQAFESDVLPDIMEDAEQFASFGYSTHHAMLREMVYTRDN